MLYNNFSSYLKNRYGGKIKKICIDGGFTCPNRDGRCGVGGCIFCGERGAGEHIDGAGNTVSDQVREYFKNPPRADGFIAYFQNFTNTYAPVEVLKEKYDSALIDGRIVALAVGTRPDCITEEIADLIASYKDKVDVWVELGLQTSNDETAKIINRGYDHTVFEKAVGILKRKSIPIVVHIIIGLPGEDIQNVADTVRFINRFDLWGIKVHSIYVMKGTRLERMYLEGRYSPPDLDDYVDQAAYVISHISPGMTVHRITGDCPRDMLIAPEWNLNKNEVINRINRTLIERGWTQGCLYRESENG